MAKKHKRSATPEERSFRNDPESRDLTIEEATLFEAARQAVTLLKKTFETWTVIGKAVQAARSRADRIGGGKTFRRILEQQGLARIVPPATATRLLAIMHVLPAVNDWHAKQSEQRQIAWASPSAVFKHCPVFASAKSQAKATNRSIPKPRLEPAIDALVDHLTEMAVDERMAVLDRILSPFNLTATPTRKAKGKPAAVQQQAEVSANVESSTAAPERKTKTPKAKTAKAKAKLEWAEADIDFGDNKCSGFTAPDADGGDYTCIDINNDGSRWVVFHSRKGADRPLDGSHRTPKAAKAAAQLDHDGGGGGG